jgi:hypothetical protein
MADDTTTPRSRRKLLAGAIGGASAMALGAMAGPAQALAAAGDPMILGQSNNSGTSQTTLTNAGTGAAFTLRSTNVSTGATGIFGWSAQTGTNVTRGVYGRADGANANGVVGVQNGDVGFGAAVLGEGGVNYGVVGTTTEFDVVGIYGISGAIGGTAVRGENLSFGDENLATGVFGESTGTGILFDTTGLAAGGVVGIHSNGGETILAAGVVGESFDPDGFGMYALNWDETSGATGLFATTLATDGDFAGYFDGNVEVVGTVAGAGPVAIMDDPLDPSGAYLYQSSVVGAERMTFYNGNVRVGPEKEATVELPAYFEALNGDPRYQLTVIGKPAQAWIKSGVEGNTFVIATDTEDVDVSWLVSGVRQDAWAKARPFQPSIAKTGTAKGKYLHPEAHGKQATDGINHERSQQAGRERRTKAEILKARRGGRTSR